jgi:cation diffusion facilitator family transporter
LRTEKSNKLSGIFQPLEIVNKSLHFEQRTKIIVILTAITMVVEISFGYYTNSMALLADGWHMGSHVFALGLTWLAYVISRRFADSDHFRFDRDKFLSLTGYTSALVLLGFAFFVGWKSVARFITPMPIRYLEAVIVAVIGLMVNIVSAWYLHHDHEHHDHNIRAAYLHVLADGMTSLAAIIALTGGMLFDLPALDSISGIICSLVIVKWSFDLIKSSGKRLIGFEK